MEPKGWEKRNLQGYISIKHGFAFKSEYFTDSGTLVLLTPGSFYEDGGFRDQKSKTKYYFGEVPDGYLLSKDDLLLAMTEQAEGLLGSALFVPENDKYLHNQRLGLVQILNQNKVCLEFLYLFFNNPSSRKQITEQSTGTKVKHTSPDRLCSVVGLIPPIGEQKKIAKILSTWDQAIATTERLLDLARQQKKALMQQLLTGKKRVPGFSLPWRRIELAQLIREVTKKKVENPELIELLTVRLHNKGVIPSGKFPNPTEGGRPYYRRNKGEIIIGRQNLHNGGVAIVGTECDGLIASNAISSFEVTAQGNPAFILELMSTEKFKVTINNLIGGTGQKEISTKELMKLRVSVPSLDEQAKIADVLFLANQEVSTLQSQLDGLKQEKKALMQALLTGKRRVKVVLPECEG